MSILSSMDKSLCLIDTSLNVDSVDVTSTIAAMDDGIFQASSPNNHDQYLIENINTINCWLDRNCVPTMLMLNKTSLSDTYKHVLALKKRLQMLLNTMKSQLKFRRKHYNLERIACDYQYNFINRQHIVEVLQAHDHFENNLSQIDLILKEDDNKQAVLYEGCSENSGVSSNSTLSSKHNKKTKSVFEYTYLPGTLKKLYPEMLMLEVQEMQNKNPLYSIQVVAPRTYDCLVCRYHMSRKKNLKLHVSGKLHRQMISIRTVIDSCHNYHKIFGSLPYLQQIHQVFFFPSEGQLLSCKLCNTILDASKLIEHIMCPEFREELKVFDCTSYHYYKVILNACAGKTKSFNKPKSDEYNTKIPDKIVEANNLITTKIITNSSLKQENHNDDSDGSEVIEFEEEYLQDKDDNAVESDGDDRESLNDAAESDSKDSSGDSENPTPNEADGEQTPESESQENKRILHRIIASYKADPQNTFEMLENRFFVHKNFIIAGPAKKVYCNLCNKILNDRVEVIKHHIISYNHLVLSKQHKKKNMYSFYCDLCELNVKNELQWLNHATNMNHLQKLSNVENRDVYKEYDCKTCKMVIFGNDFSLVKHQDKALLIEKNKKKKVYKLVPQVEKMLRSNALLLEEVNKLSVESEKVLSSMDIVNNCCKAFEEALAKVFPQCRAYPFGSRVSGLGSMTSDLDIFVDIGDMFFGNNFQEAEDQIELVRLTAKTLMANKHFVDICTIPSARTPIVQVYHLTTGLDCDLSFRHGLSVENTAYLRFNIEIQPILKDLILFLKKWSRKLNVCERISTYALAMLAIFYMQVMNYLPSVKKIREIDPTPPKVIAGWQSFIFTKSTAEVYEYVTKCNLPINEILRNFFGFYSKFKFSTEVVCPLLGYSVKKADFTIKGQKLPVEMKSYVDKIQMNKDTEIFRSLCPICIQDPFDLSHNLTKACSESMVRMFAAMCQLSFTALTDCKS